MKRIFIVLAMIFLGISNVMAKFANKNVLIVYYSMSGNTETVANKIHDLVGGDIFELETEKTYPSNYRELTREVKKEIENGVKPTLKNNVENIEKYDVIFLGSPCWWSTYAPVVATFLEENDLSDKTIIPFMTHGGSGMGRSEEDLKNAEPRAKILDGLAVYGSRVENSDNIVKEFLDNVKFE